MTRIKHKETFWRRIYDKVMAMVKYITVGVWTDSSTRLSTRLIKTVNFTVMSAQDINLFDRSTSLTYRTVLSIVPAFALLIALCKGFGLQEVVTEQIYQIFPSQQHTATVVDGFVESYLKETSHGLFIGVGILFLIYTVISLMKGIEENFNAVWGVRDSRPLYKKLMGYVAICLIVPLLLICSAGLNIFMTSAFRSRFNIPLLSDALNLVLDLAPFFLICLALIFSFRLIPHARVKFRYAIPAGLLTGIAFEIVQMLFINGQIYVSRYNAIYGSLAFLPLLLIWLQLSWMIVLYGVTLTYSSQYIFCYPTARTVSNLSERYLRRVVVVTAAVVAARYSKSLIPLSAEGISAAYGLPVRLVEKIVDRFKKAGLIYFVDSGDTYNRGVVPAFDLRRFTVAELLQRFDASGFSGFISDFDTRYQAVLSDLTAIENAEETVAKGMLLSDLADKIPAISATDPTADPSDK